MSTFFPYFEEFVLSRVLEQKYSNQRMTDMFVDHLLESDPDSLPLEHINVCARIPAPLVRELEVRLNFLGISKRRFLEFAIHHALNAADKVIGEHAQEINENFGSGVVKNEE